MYAHRPEPTRPRKARTSAFTSALACLSLFAAACGGDDGRGPVSRVAGLVQGRGGGRPVLRVAEREFSNADLRAYLDANVMDTKGLPRESLSRLYDRFVDDMILLQAARDRGITLGEDEKSDHLAKLAVEPKAAAGPGRAVTAATEGAFDRLLIEKYVFLVGRDARVDAAEVHDYYEAHKRDFLKRERIQVSQILVDSEEKAVSVLRRLERTGEREFRRIATEESIGPEAPRGGMMGIFEQGDLPADMEKVIFALDEGRTSQVVESSYGFHIFRLDRKSPPALQDESDAAPEIRKRILAQKTKDALALHLRGLKETLEWQAFPENLSFAYQRLDE